VGKNPTRKIGGALVVYHKDLSLVGNATRGPRVAIYWEMHLWIKSKRACHPMAHHLPYSARLSTHTEENTAEHKSIEALAVSMARKFFADQPAHAIASRGRIILEPHAPFYITSCSGMAAKLLQTSCFKLAGRRVRAIAQPAEIAKLEQATHFSLVPRQRVYLSLATEIGHVNMDIQTCKSTAGRMHIEVSLFPASQDSRFEEIVLDNINQAKSSGSNSPDKDLAVSPVDSDDDEVFAGVGAHWASAELIDKLDNFNLTDCKDNPISKCSHADIV